MDKLYRIGLTNIFLLIALAVVKKYGIDTNYCHLDSTSFSLDGNYENKSPEVEGVKSSSESQSTDQEILPKPINITHGYSRDKRPDLKQFILDLIVSGDGDIPLFVKTGDGNETDKAVFGKILAEFKKQVDWSSIYVADSALYTQNNLLLIKDLKWITRVPLSIQAAQHLVTEVKSTELVLSQEHPGYSFSVKTSNYGGIPQRWLIVESEKADAANSEVSSECKLHQERKESDLKKLKKKLNKKLEESQQLLSRLSRKKFENAAAAKAILQADDILKAYREQQCAERGFSFLKDPLFFADSVFLKNSSRIETMAMLMGLCLLVYKIGQRQLRLNLKRAQTGVKNQLGKLTDRPTLRWIFQCLQGIHVLIINGIKQISNLTDERLRILQFFPQSCQKYYLLL